MISLIDSKNPFDKIQYPFIVIFLQPDKGIFKKLNANTIHNDKRQDTLPMNRTKMPILTTCILHYAGVYSHYNNGRIKSIFMGHEEVKLSLLADNMTVYVENQTESTKKLLELIEFCKVEGCKINILKSIVFLSMNSEHSIIKEIFYLHWHQKAC